MLMRASKDSAHRPDLESSVRCFGLIFTSFLGQRDANAPQPIGRVDSFGTE